MLGPSRRRWNRKGVARVTQTRISRERSDASLTDGNNNPANFGYDGFDRLSTTTFPDGSYEQLGYDGTGQLWSQRRRDGTNVTPGHDNLFRVTSRTLPNKGVIQRDYTSDDVSRPRHFFVTVARG